MFSDRFEALCRAKGVKPGRACTEMGVSRTLAAKWKATGTEKPSAEVLEKMSAYFGLSIDEILGNENAPTREDERPVSDDDIKFALWGTREIDDDVLEQVKAFAKFARANRKDQ